MSGYINPEEPQWPVTQGFGQFPGGYNPVGGHTGRDKATPTGRPLRSPCDGKITLAGNAGPWNTNEYWLEGAFAGLSVVVESTDGAWAFTLNHLSEVRCKVGQIVKKGDIIAISGNSGGATTGSHHHFETMPNGWNFQNGTFGRVNPDTVCKGSWTGAAPVATVPNQRITGEASVNQRATAAVTGKVVRLIPGNQLEVFEGFVHGQKVTVGKITTDVWFKDKVGYAWAGGFTSQATAGLPDMTPRAALAANQRLAGPTGVRQRKAADTTSPVVREIPGKSVEIFTGFVRTGKPITVGVVTTDIWYVDAKGFAWAGGFESQSTVGLPDLTVVKSPIVVPPPVVVKPPVTPTPPKPTAPPVTPVFVHMNGIDVASYQESAALQTIETDFYFIKASEGVGWSDPALASNVAEARLSGRPVGFYHYARPFATADNTALAEAESFLHIIKPHLQIGDTIALDWEAENQHRTDWALDWLRYVETATGALPFIYLNTSAINGSATQHHDWNRVEREFPLWFAGYGANLQQNGFAPRPPVETKVEWTKGIIMWQYSSKGRLTNYEGDLDLNVFYGTTATWKEKGATKLLQEPVPNPPIVEVPKPSTDAAVLQRFFSWLIDLFVKSGR